MAMTGNVSPDSENAMTEYPPPNDMARRMSAVSPMMNIDIPM